MVSKKSIAFVAQNRAIDDAAHIAARGHFSGGNLNLVAMAVGVCDSGAEDYSINTGPKRGAHAHGAWFAGGVERVPDERDLLEPPGGETNRAHLRVSAGIALLPHGIERAQKQLS